MKHGAPESLNSLSLAYIGDAIYEVYVREHVLCSGRAKPKQLHNHTVQYVSANAQSAVLHDWLATDVLTEDEIAVVKRGRNAKSKSTPKNMSIADYRHATAFEALIGFHYLSNNKQRLDTLQSYAVAWIDQQKTK